VEEKVLHFSAWFWNLFGLWSFLEPAWPLFWIIIKIVCILLPLLGAVAYMTLAERKILAWMHIRLGPNRVGPLGLFQPIADGIKLIFKEIIIPERADRTLFLMGPVLAMAPALAVWAIVPFADGWVLSNVDAGVLLMLAITSFGVYGVIIAGWASNSKYPFLGAMRASAQMVSYEVSMGLGLITVLMVSNSLNLTEIVRGQAHGMFADKGIGMLSWNWLPLLPMFLVYLISGVAETNRAPFDVVEGESEIVAGHMTEYSGMGFALFFLAEYANMILISTMVSIFFLGGWLSPVSFLHHLPLVGFAFSDGFHWLFLKLAFFLFFFVWIRATFPRYRYDQIMRLGWKIFVPLCLVWILVIGVWMMSPWTIWS
jgi:NADH-quinone oxidoreductase subunit H